MADKRQIRGEKHNVAELVQNAMVAIDSLTFDNAKSRDAALLRELAKATGAWGFEGQLGKIDFSSTEKAISDVNAYLSRRNQAHRSRWTAKRGY